MNETGPAESESVTMILNEVQLLFPEKRMALGVYLILHAFRRIRHFDRMIEEIKRTHSRLARFME